MTGWRIPRESDDLQRIPGTLRSPPCTGHGSDPGVGYQPPPALPQVLHVCHMEGAQWQTPGCGDVFQGVGVEVESMTRGRGEEEHGGDLSGLRETFGGGGRVQITWEGADSFR